MAGFAIDIRRERAGGPEVRRTTGGLPYRVSRTNTPDLEEIRRELDRQSCVSAHGSALQSAGRVPHPPQQPPAVRQEASANQVVLEGFTWIQTGLSTSLVGNKHTAPSNTTCTNSQLVVPREAGVKGSRTSDSQPPTNRVRPQTGMGCVYCENVVLPPVA